MSLVYNDYFCGIATQSFGERLILALESYGVDIDHLDINYAKDKEGDTFHYILITDPAKNTAPMMEVLYPHILALGLELIQRDDGFGLQWVHADALCSLMHILENMAQERIKGTANYDENEYPGDESFISAIKQEETLLYFMNCADGYVSLSHLFKETDRESQRFDGNYLTYTRERLLAVATRQEKAHTPHQISSLPIKTV